MASYILLGVNKETDSSMQLAKLSPLGEACSRVDLAAIHDILEKLGYNDHARIAEGVSPLIIYSINKMNNPNI